MRATLSTTAKKFGTCSDKFQSIARAWEKICVPTGVPSAVNHSAPCTSIDGPNWVCEEDDIFSFCIASNAGINFDYGRWTILGQNSTSFKSLKGMIGNTQEGSSCLKIIDIPKFSYYPQTITVQYYNSQVGNKISKTIRIIDCNRDDPTCNDFYGYLKPDISKIDNEELFFSDDININVESRNSDADEDLRIIIYDLMGNVVHIPKDQFFDIKSNLPQILILTYWNKEGNMIKSKKILKF